MSKDKKKVENTNRSIVENFGDLLVAELNTRKTTAPKFSKDSGIAYDVLIKLMRGARSPNLKTVEKIANGLGMTIPELLSGNGA